MKIEEIKLKDSVFYMYRNIPTEFIVVKIINQKSIYPFGSKELEIYPIGIVEKREFNSVMQRIKDNLSGSNNYCENVELHKIFKTKEDLLKSL